MREFEGKRSHRSEDRRRKAAQLKRYKSQPSQPNGCYLLRELIEGNEAGDGSSTIILEMQIQSISLPLSYTSCRMTHHDSNVHTHAYRLSSNEACRAYNAELTNPCKPAWDQHTHKHTHAQQWYYYLWVFV